MAQSSAPLKRILFAGMTALTFIGHPTIAEAQVSGPSAVSAQSIKLYEKPDRASPSIDVPIKDFSFPMAITERAEGMVAVLHQGKIRWMRSMDVRISRSSSTDCTATSSQTNQPLTAGSPGAGKSNCR